MATQPEAWGKRLAAAVLALAVLALGVLALGRAAPVGAQGEWRIYRNPALGFKVLYPPGLATRALNRRVGTGTVAVQEWTRAGSKATIRLTLIDKPAGTKLRDWVKREHAGKIVEHTVAGRPAFIQEGLFEGQLTTDVYLEEPKSGKVINFSHAVRGIENWMAQKLNAVKNRHRAELGDFWNMVESIRFAE